MFADMRLELLSGSQSVALRGALYGLLMLLPQTDAFHTLRNRLQCAPTHDQPLMPYGSLDPRPTLERCNTPVLASFVSSFSSIYKCTTHQFVLAL